jgi:hypothetical protein
MKFLTNIMVMAIFFISPFLAGCAQQTSSLQNQQGQRAAATKAKDGVFDDWWFSSKIVHPSFGVSTNANIAAHLVNQAELEKPRALGKVNPMAAVGAVDRYQQGQVRALPEVDVSVGGGGSGSGQSN